MNQEKGTNLILFDTFSKLERTSNYGAWKVKIRTILMKEDLQGLVFPQGDDQNAKEMVVNIGDVKGVAGDAFDYYLTLIPTTMITKMVMKCRYKALATIIITSKRMN